VHSVETLMMQLTAGDHILREILRRAFRQVRTRVVRFARSSVPAKYRIPGMAWFNISIATLRR